MDYKQALKTGSMGYLATLEFVRERDKHSCQMCGRKRKKGERQLDVHHLNEFEGKDKEFREDHEPDKMVTLCRRCHLNLPHVRKRMSEGRKK